MCIKAFGFADKSIMILHGMRKDEDLSTASYACLMTLQLHMSFLTNMCHVKCLGEI